MYEKAMAMPGYGGGDYYNGQEPITVDGVTILPDNPFYGNIQNLDQMDDYLDASAFSTPEAMDLVIEMGDMELDYFLRAAQAIISYEDYRLNLVWDTTKLYEKFIYENAAVTDIEVLKEALNYRYYVDPSTFEATYVSISATDRQAEIDKRDEYINRLYNVIESNNFDEFIAISIEQQQSQIDSINKSIEIQEQTIIEHPEQEEDLSRYIEDMKKQIKIITDSSIPMLQFRLEKNIVPGEDIWQNDAISSIENASSQLAYTTVVTEDEFIKEQYLIDQYKTYSNYKTAIQKQIDEFNNDILVAESSLYSDKPDMKFVPEGARNQTNSFLYYSVFVALFGVILGGWLMASEFQLGTIRLLMIRPKTRTKILMSKFTAALVICLGIYIAGAIINIVTNGICFGFSDFAFPNYTASGEVGFFAYYIPKFLACSVTIIFGYCTAFMLSTVAKNIAISIAVPSLLFVACIIGIGQVAYAEAAFWLAWTPVPYVQMSQFFTQYSPVQIMLRAGAPISLGYGIGLLLGLSVIFTIISAWVFKKKDITN
jgi:ABC-2 type transport system permease protein